MNRKLRVFFLCFVFLFSNYLFASVTEQSIEELIHAQPSKDQVNKLIEFAEINLLSNSFEAYKSVYVAKEVSEELKYNDGYIQSSLILGELYLINSIYDKAISEFENIIDLLKTDEKQSQYYILSLNKLAYIFEMTNKKDDAIKIYEQCLAYNSGKNDPESRSGILFKIGMNYYKEGKYQEAIEQFEQSLTLSNDNENENYQALLLHHIGKCMMGMENYQQAFEYFSNSYEIYQKNRGNNGEALVLLDLAILDMKRNNLKMSEAYLKDALQIGNESGLIDIQISAHKLLSELYELTRDWSLGFLHSKLSDELEADLLLYTKQENQKVNKLQLLITEFIAERKYINQAEQNQKFAESKLSKRYLIFSIIGFILVLVIIALIILLIKNNLRNARKIEKKIKEIKAIRNEMEKTLATKEKFFSIITHDLKNPLNALLGFSGLLVNEYDQFNDRDKKKYLKQIYSATDNILKMLNNLLAWSKTQNGAMKPKFESFNMTEMINNILDLVNTQAKSKNIRIETELNNNISAFADKNMISTVVRNLVTNAIKFTPQNGKVLIGAQLKDSILELIVEDNGIGISKEDQKYLFSFEKKNGRHTGTNGETGTGLGLILCKEFTDRNEGEILVESEEGKGSKFILKLPVETVN